MIGHLLKTAGYLTLVAVAGSLMASNASAGGSIGGDCCADLEERVAELEATTAHKGNRKVSLTVYGQVNKALLFADVADVRRAGRYNPARSGFDGPQIIDNDISGTRFGLKGRAAISSDLYASYKLEFQVVGTSADVGSHPNFDDVLRLRHNDLFIASKTLGKISLGHGSTASDGIAEIDLSGTAIAGGSKYLTGESKGYYTINPDQWAGIYKPIALQNLDGDSRKERIRYDTPTLAGCKLSASWQENEDWDIALRYAASLGDYTIAAGIAYLDEEESENRTSVSGSVSALHIPTGLNVTFAAGELDDSQSKYSYSDPQNVIGAVYNGAEAVSYWYVKAGIKRNFFGIGNTAFSVDYHNQENKHTVNWTCWGCSTTEYNYETEKWGVQLVQNIDAVAIELYVSA